MDVISYTKAKRAEELAEQIIEGSIDTGVLQTNINTKLANLETQYAPRLTTAESQLAQSATIKLEADITGTTYKANQKVDLEYLRQQQIVLYGSYLKKFRRKEAVKLVAQGDSLTYGHDVNSADKRPADTSTNTDGVVHTQTRASITYPEALQSRLKYINPLTTVENRGYSGDSVLDGFNRWKSDAGADLYIIDYGINDAQSYSNIAGDLNTYFYWYEQLIIRLILQGSAVVLLSPTKIIATGNVGLDISTFRESLDTLARKYNVPLLDGDEMLHNYNNSIYSGDTVHLNGKGYEILGTRIAAALLSNNLLSPLNVTTGSKILTSVQRDNIYTVLNTSIENSGDAPTPSETSTNEAWGTVANIKQDGELLYSFYADTDDLVTIPYFQLGGDLTVTFELDFGVEQPRTSLASAIDRSNSQKLVPSIVTKALTGAWKHFNKLTSLGTDNLTIHITTKGWHTLKVKNTNTATKSIYFHGLEFAHFDTLKSLVVTNKTTLESSFYKGIFYPTYAPPFASITETRVKLDELKRLLNFDSSQAQSGNTWNDTPLKITINNDKQSILTYTFVIGYDANSRFLSPVSRINIAATPTERTLIAINVDWTAKELILTWGGDTARVSSFQISVA